MTKDNKILTVYKNNLNFNFLNQFPIDTEFEIQMEKDDFFKEHIESGIIAFVNEVPNIGDLGICIIRKRNSNTFLEYYPNPKKQNIELEIKPKSMKNSSLAGETYITYTTEDGRYEELIKNIKFTEIKEKPVGSIFKPVPINPIKKQYINEEQYATLMYKNKDGIILKFIKTKQQDQIFLPSEEWIEWIEFPKENNK